jgi:hypothetical protein
MKIEIVVNCYAVERPWYAALFCYQLSSLALHKPKHCEVTVSLCCSAKDKVLEKVLEYFHSLGAFHLSVSYAHASVIAKRAIHRNMMCRSTYADILWFTDPDYVFGENCLDTLATLEWPKEAVLVFPRQIWEQKHETISIPSLKLLTREPQIAVVSPHEFEKKTFQRAIGSIQIVQADFAIECGYCENYPSHQTPTDIPFVNYSSISDRNFRRECKRKSGSSNFQQAIKLPNVFRLNHPNRKLSPEKAKQKYKW